MKALVFVLVLANLMFYAVSRGFFGQGDNPDAQRIAQQVAPERLHIVGRGEQPAANAEPVAAMPTGGACLRWEKLVAADAEQLASLIADKFPDFKESRQTVASEGSGWWVFIPPLASRAEAEKKAAELRARGVTDYFINGEAGPQRHAISLGVFSTEKGAQERLAELKARTVRSAQIAMRPGKDNLVTLDATGPLAELAALRAAALEQLPRQTPRDCP